MHRYDPSTPRTRRANAVAELSVLLDASRTLTSSLEYEATLARVVPMCVPTLAEYCRVELTGNSGELRVLAEAGAGPFCGGAPMPAPDPHGSPAVPPAYGSLGVSALLRVTMTARARTLGYLWFINFDPERSFSQECLLIADQLALTAAFAIDSARMYARERHVADTLQRALLPEHLPSNGLHRFHAAYTPGAQEANVGGDWYDAFDLPDGRVALSVGDVAGHGLGAAVIMGEVRHAFRTTAMTDPRPSKVLERANLLLNSREDAVMVTAIFGFYDPKTRELTYASAGHPAPIVALPGGYSATLPTSGIPLGIGSDLGSTDWTFTLVPGSLLVFYTDGLIEYARDALQGERRLLAAVHSPAVLDAQDPARELLAAIFQDVDNTDDAAALALRIADRTSPDFSGTFSAVPSAVPFIRLALRRYAGGAGIDDDTIFAMQTGIGEAVANAIEHAYGDRVGLLHIDVTLTEKGVRATIEDFGCWRPPATTETRGRGFPIMRAVARDVEIQTRAESTKISLYFARPSAPSASSLG